MKSGILNIGLTMGDPSGIGPEVVIKAILEIKNSLRAGYVIIGDKNILENCCRRLKIKNFFGYKGVQLIDFKNVKRKNFKFGKTLPQYGRASLEYLNEACALLKGKYIQALVTSPVSKAAINASGINFQGHTEYLASSFRVKNFIMMMLNKNLRVVPLTRHIALKEVPKKINYSIIYNSIKLTVYCLKKYFSITRPKIAVCALNPHSGEGGFLGKEEKEVIIPAIKKLNQNIRAKVLGPFSADGLFPHYRKNKFDCIVGMYHDQVLIPIKFLDYQRVVNLTLGLPFIRTSPSHGTAFDIAGKGIASSASMVEAIKLAYQLSCNVFSQ